MGDSIDFKFTHQVMVSGKSLTAEEDRHKTSAFYTGRVGLGVVYPSDFPLTV